MHQQLLPRGAYVRRLLLQRDLLAKQQPVKHAWVGDEAGAAVLAAGCVDQSEQQHDFPPAMGEVAIKPASQRSHALWERRWCDRSVIVTGVDALALVDAIPGWMLPGDAEKLYELAQAADGPVLEIGTYRGRSAVLMALAMCDADHEALLYSIDVDQTAQHAAAAAAHARGLTDRIVLIRGTLAAFARAYPQLRPALTFVDGDHTETGVERDLAVLETLVPAGGCLLFHDFTDPRNDDPQCDEIAVRPTVLRSWVAEQCEFNGEFGCCGLFTRLDAPPDAGVATADLLGLASLRDQYLYRVRNPAGRAWRRIRKQE
jgi:predicted O-methyltransferase YrrM